MKTNKEEIFSYLEERFGLDRKLFDGFEFLEASKGRVYMATKESAHVAGLVKPVTLGLLFARVHGSVKLSSNITQLFGDKATKGIVKIDRDQAKQFIEGENLEILKTDATEGYVIIKYRDYPLGIGLLKCKKDGGQGTEGFQLKNMLPKAKRIKISDPKQ